MILIYKHTLNGKCYIGQTCKKISHRSGRDFSRYDRQPHFYNAVQKCGVENVTTEILYRCETLEEANRLETLCIARYDTFSNGYNLTTGGKCTTVSEETRQKGREAKLGEKNPMFGKTLSPESRSDISKKLTGRKRPKEVCDNISNGLKQRYKCPEERQKARENALKQFNNAFRRKGKDHPRYGIPRSTETKRKLSLANQHPDHQSAKAFFFALPVDMPQMEKRKRLYAKYPHIKHDTKKVWARKWEPEELKGKASNKHPDYDEARSFFFALPADMPQEEQRQRFHKRFPHVAYGTRKHWAYVWGKEKAHK